MFFSRPYASLVSTYNGTLNGGASTSFAADSEYHLNNSHNNIYAIPAQKQLTYEQVTYEHTYELTYEQDYVLEKEGKDRAVLRNLFMSGVALLP